MLYKLAALAVALFHLSFILFVMFGGLLVLKWPRLMWIHIPCAVWGMLVEFTGWFCPLTNWEKHFLHMAGGAGYTGGFIEHYIMPLIYPAGLTRGIQVVLGLLVLVVNAGVYVKVFR